LSRATWWCCCGSGNRVLDSPGGIAGAAISLDLLIIPTTRRSTRPQGEIEQVAGETGSTSKFRVTGISYRAPERQLAMASRYPEPENRSCPAVI
jgi:hypothetical protein